MAYTTSTIPVTIGGTLIEFPNSGASPIWSPAILQFVQAVEEQFLTINSPFDIAPTVQILTSNANVDILLNGNGVDLEFPSDSVRSFEFTYAIYRVTNSTSIVDSGIVSGVYNTTTLTWSLEHNYQGDVQSNGQPWNTFSIDSQDRLTLTTEALSGVYDSVNSTISYSASTQIVSV